MSDFYPDEALDFPVMNIADVIRFDLDETLFLNDASPTHGLYALALALAWRLQSYPMAERAMLHAGIADLSAPSIPASCSDGEIARRRTGRLESHTVSLPAMRNQTHLSWTGKPMPPSLQRESKPHAGHLT
jgi:hypothetical protein